MNTCPHCGEPLVTDTPETLADWLAMLQFELTTLAERLRETMPERPLYAQVELAEEHLRDAFNGLTHSLPPDGTARMYRPGEPEGSRVDPRPSSTCASVLAERDRLRDRLRVIESERV